MTKRLVALFLLVTVCLWTSGVAGATEQVAYDGPAWTFDVPLSALNDALLVLASPLSPLESTAEPLNLVSVQSRRNGENGENLNGGLRKASNTSMKLDADAYAALVMLFNGAEDAGVELYLRQGYRSYEDQATRYETAVSRGETEGVPQAGQTDYQTGPGRHGGGQGLAGQDAYRHRVCPNAGIPVVGRQLRPLWLCDPLPRVQGGHHRRGI